MILMSLLVFETQSRVSRGDCFATCARNDMQDGALRELQSHKEMLFANGAPKGVLRKGVAP